MHLDIVGKEIFVGDKVVFIGKQTRKRMTVGIVTALNKKMIKVSYKNNQTGMIIFSYVYPDQVSVITL